MGLNDFFLSKFLFCLSIFKIHSPIQPSATVNLHQSDHYDKDHINRKLVLLDYLVKQ